MLTGEVDIDQRMEMIDRFQDVSQDQFILLVSTMAGGVGLNLTAVSGVLQYEPDQRPTKSLFSIPLGVSEARGQCTHFRPCKRPASDGSSV